MYIDNVYFMENQEWLVKVGIEKKRQLWQGSEMLKSTLPLFALVVNISG